VASAIFGLVLLRLQAKCTCLVYFDQFGIHVPLIPSTISLVAVAFFRQFAAMSNTSVAYIRRTMVIVGMFYFILSCVSSLMSTPTTPAGSPQRDAAASWKRKYELLEMQYAMQKEPNSRSQKQVVPHMCSMIPTNLSSLVPQPGRSPWVEVSVAQ
jgi:hypothetical protein